MASIQGRFLLGTGGYFVLQLLIRTAFPDALELDEAEQMLFGQWLLWGYSSQPPLYTWLQKAAFAVFGPNVLALSLVKNGLQFALYAFAFLAAREIVKDDRRAVLSALALLLMPPIAWESARDLTHSVLAAVLAAANMYFAIMLLERRSLASHLGFAVTLGLGMLSKSNFALHLLALLGACLTAPQCRAALFAPRTLTAVSVGGLLYAPHGWWLWHHGEALSDGIDKLMPAAGAGQANPAAKFAVAAGAYIAPLSAAWLLVFRRVWRRPIEAIPKSLGSALLSRYFLVLVALLLATLGLTGQIKTRWLYPFMVLFPPLLFSALPAEELTAGRCRAFLGLAATAGALVVILMYTRVSAADWLNRPTDINLPFSEFARHIRANGFREGIIIGHNAHVAGNFRLQFPDRCQAFSPRSEQPFPDRPEDDILIVWLVKRSAAPPEKLAAFVRKRLGVALKDLSPRYVKMPYHRSSRSEAEIGYVILRRTDFKFAES